MWSQHAPHAGLSQYRWRVPELPEVEALVQDLSRRLHGRAIVRVDIAAFSCLKTYDPPISALSGGMVDSVTRHGKFLDIDVSGTHLVLHLARAGWVRWKEEVPAAPAAAEQQVAARGPDRDRTRRRRPGARTRRHRGGDAQEPGAVRRPRPRRRGGHRPTRAGPSRRGVHRRGARRASCATRAGRRSRACCATRARSRASATPTPTSCCTPRRCRRSSPPAASPTPSCRRCTTRSARSSAMRSALGRARRERAQG